MIKINKILIVFLSILFVIKIVIWQIDNLPIERGSMLIIILLIFVLAIQNKVSWFLGMIIFIFSFTFNERLLIYLKPLINKNIFCITDSLVNFNTDHNLRIITELIPPFLFVTLFLLFSTRYYRVKYSVSQKPKEWTFWNRIW